MKLRQREYCHNCQQHVIYEFDDITDRQVIICPNCGHQHYRELDEGTIVNIRLDGGRQLRVMELQDLQLSMDCETDFALPPIVTKEYDVVGHTPDGRPIVKKTDDIKHVSTQQTRLMTERRWGRDPRQ